MKVAVLHGVGDLRLDDIETPVAGARDVVVQVKSAGICGTDIGFFRSGSPTGAPVALGHELAGVIAEVGEAVSNFRVGDRVVLNPLVNLVGNGGPEGGFADRLLIRDIASRPQSLIPLPEGLSFDVGALVEPLAVALHAVSRSGAKPGDKVAIFGAGPIGLGLIVALRQRGIEDIVAFDLSPFRRGRAMELGARAALDPREKTPAEALKELHGVELFFGMVPVATTDLFFEASGAPHVIGEIIASGKSNSSIVLVSNHKKPVELDLQLLLGKEMSLTTAMGYPDEMPDVVAMLEKAAPDLEPMVSHRFAADDLLEAFDTACRPDVSAKVLLRYP